MSRPTPDGLNADEDVLSQLISEAGDPEVEPRPEHVDDLRALILDRLSPPRAARPSRRRWLVVSGLAAACLVAVLARPRGDGKPTISGNSGQLPSDPVTPQPREDHDSVADWGNVRRGLNLSEMPAFSWPLDESSRLSKLSSVPRDLLD